MTVDTGSSEALTRLLGPSAGPWAALTTLLGDGVIITDADLDAPGPRILFVNDAVVDGTGYAREELLGASPRIFQGPGTDAGERARVRAALQAGTSVRAELVNHRKDGSEFIVELELNPIRDADGAIVGFVGIQRDVTEQRLVNRWFRSLVEHSGEMVCVTAPDGIVSYVSPSVECMLGWRPEDIVGRIGAEFVHPDDATRLTQGLLQKSHRPGTNPPVEFRFRHADGSWRWLEAVTTNLLDEPAVRSMVVNARDITERRRIDAEREAAEQTSVRLLAELHERAIRDELTGLVNRDEARRLVAAGATASGPIHSVIAVDVDAFGPLNETYGHEVGDAVLVEASARLRAVVPAGSTVARIGADEFLVMLPCDLRGATSVAEHLLAAVRAPFDRGGRPLEVTASAGVAGAVTSDADRTLRRAELALAAARRRGRDQWEQFTEEMEVAALTRVVLERDLRVAISRDQLRLHFQPSFDLATSRVCGMEALVRWQHPERGLLAPGAFVPIAEASGQIGELGRWVARHACATRARLGRELGDRMDGVTMWINCSALELEQPWYSADLVACLRAAGLGRGELGVELTESALMRDVDVAIEHLRVLTAAGIRVAIDDFGTGYSSFASLARVPADVLKLDATFSQAAAADPTTATLVRAITDLGRSLGARTCLEGIETPAQLDVARIVGADMVSGFLFARPQPEEHLVRTVVAA